MELNEISGQVVDAAMKVHTVLVEQACLVSRFEQPRPELHKRGLTAKNQVDLPVIYEDVKIDVGYRLDLLVEDQVIVELKAVEKVLPIHEAQLLSYLKLSDSKLGLLINFNVSAHQNRC